MTEGDGIFDEAARLDYALVPASAWQAGLGIPGFVRFLSSHLRSPSNHLQRDGGGYRAIPRLVTLSISNHFYLLIDRNDYKRIEVLHKCL